MTGAAALFPVLLFSTTEPARRLTAADCAAPEASLVIGTVWWFPALILALGYLYIIQRHSKSPAHAMKELAAQYPGILNPYFARVNARGGPTSLFWLAPNPLISSLAGLPIKPAVSPMTPNSLASALKPTRQPPE
jgi:hypothetical protein